MPTVIDVIGRVNSLWMNLMYKGRKIAREVLPLVTGFSVEMVESWGFNHFLNIIKKENLPLFGKLHPGNFKVFNRLNEGLVKAFGEIKISHSNYNPEIIGHICAGNILSLAAFEMVMDKLVDAATWVKVSSEEPVFGALYAKSIEEVNPKIAHTIAVLPFDSKDDAVKEFLFSKSDIVRVTGGQQAREKIIKLAEKYKVPVAGHWHKFSFITIAREYLNERARDIAELVSLDVCAWDQQGCFSPQEIYVEEGGSVSPKDFARLLAEEMEVTSRALPKGSKSGKMQILDGYYQYFKKEVMGEPVKIFSSPSNQWLVIYDATKTIFEPSPLFRVIKVKPIKDIMEIPKLVKPIGEFLQTVGVSIPNNRLIPFADAVGEAGATNIRAISSMTLQKAWEPWDGRFPLHELFEHDNVRWVSISTADIDQELKKALERKRAIVNQKINSLKK
ncbi:MAG: acyl-CoA reductase [Candidatus Thermoplasmatota archaeon]|nr:acyl-CoA reductase [Candidatus Thermoplasmatota archaeon]